MAYFPSSVTWPSILGEIYSAALTVPAFNWQCSPAVTELETIVLDWMAGLLHLPESFLSRGEGGGVIQGSASESIVTVMVAARERFVKKASEGLTGKEQKNKISQLRGKLVALGSEQSHSSTMKAAIIAGVHYRAISCRLEDDLALTGQGFQGMLEECKREGLEPFYLTTTLGTTATCAVDHFDEITAINNRASLFPPLWIHVDAAYAGSALVCEEFAYLTAAFSHVDSFDMNMHKWLLTNFDASCLYVRHRRDLTDVLSVTPSYLRNEFTDRGLVTDYRDWQIPLGRRFRAMKIWFVLRTYGIKGLKAHIRKHIAIGEKFATWLRERPDLFQVVTPPAFALSVFTLVLPINNGSKKAELPDGTTQTGVNEGVFTADLKPDTSSEEQDRTNTLTKAVYEHINASGKFFLTSGVVKDIYAIRVVSANEKANEKSLRQVFELLISTREESIEKMQINDA